jgi:ABC-type Fe3+/spermidine/putrescine transport system ATPase subunit
MSIEVRHVTKSFGSFRAVDDVSITVPTGELVALLGPSGSGKTSLLRIIAGLEHADAGQIFFEGEDATVRGARHRGVGFVFQHYALFRHMSVFENVAFGLRERRVSGADLTRKVTAALAQVGLEGFERRRPSQLSGGQQQRVALARTLVVQPRLLLLDEPLSNLDAQLRSQMRLELARLHRDLGITTLYVTHDQAEALSLSTRIAVLSNGALVQEGRPEDIYWKPRNAFVAEFVGAANLVPVRVVELREMGVVVETSGGARVPVSAGAHVWSVGDRALLCLRPEALRVEEAALAPGGIPGTVSAHVFEGSRQFYDVTIPGGMIRVEMITSALVGRSFKLGDHVRVEVSPETSILLPDDRGAA